MVARRTRLGRPLPVGSSPRGRRGSGWASPHRRPLGCRLGEEALEPAEQLLALARLRPRSQQCDGSDERDRRPRASDHSAAAHPPTSSAQDPAPTYDPPLAPASRRPSWRLEPSFARHALARGCSFAHKQPPLFLRGDSAFQAFVRRGRYRIANEARAGRGPRDLRLAARSHRACWGRGGGAARLAAFCSTLLLAWSCRQRGEGKTRIVRPLRRERA